MVSSIEKVRKPDANELPKAERTMLDGLVDGCVVAGCAD